MNCKYSAMSITVLLQLTLLSPVLSQSSPDCDPELDPYCNCKPEICVPNNQNCPKSSSCPTALPTSCPEQGGVFCTEREIVCDNGCEVKRVTVAERSECPPRCIPDFGNCPEASFCPEGVPTTCPIIGGTYCVQGTTRCEDGNECGGARNVPTARFFECEPESTPTPTPTPTGDVSDDDDLQGRLPLLIQ